MLAGHSGQATGSQSHRTALPSPTASHNVLFQNDPTSSPPHLDSAAARPRDQPLKSSGVSWLALMPPGPSVLLTVAAAMTWWPCLKSLKVRLSFSLLLPAPAFTASLAWLAEHPLSKREAVGSNPTGGSTGVDTRWQVTVCRLQNHTATTLLRQVQQLRTMCFSK